jgi:hypothetical protein
MAYYYKAHKTDLVEAVNMCKKGISLAIQTGNARRHSQALYHLSETSILLGKYSVAQMYAYEARRLARVSGDLYTEATAARGEALCW